MLEQGEVRVQELDYCGDKGGPPPLCSAAWTVFLRISSVFCRNRKVAVKNCSQVPVLLHHLHRFPPDGGSDGLCQLSLLAGECHYHLFSLC